MAPYVHATVQAWLAGERARPDDAAGGAPRWTDAVVADIGAGQGYLTCELAGRYGYRCVAVERDGVQQHGAMRRSGSLLPLQGEGAGGGGAAGGSVTVVNMVVDGQTDAAAFEACVLGAAVPAGLLAPSTAIVLVSLHACGSLSSNMLRLFAESRRCRLVINVGCCYNLIGPGDFPMSRAVKGECAKHRPSFAGRTNSDARSSSGAPLTLSKNMLMAACQAPQKWLTEGSVGGSAEAQLLLGQSLEANAVRCVLQLLLASVLGCDDLSRIGRVAPLGRKRVADRSSDTGSVFWTYAASTVRKILSQGRGADAPSALPPSVVAEGGAAQGCGDGSAASATGRAETSLPSEEDVERAARGLAALHLSEGSATLRQMALLWAAKAVVGSVIEGLLLRDRALYIEERCPEASCRLVPLFDPRVSPRFVAVVAQKM
jgi:hypothetical protein